MVNSFLIVVTIASFANSWSLTSEGQGYFDTQDLIGTYSGPLTWDADLSSNPDCTLHWVVGQEKGEDYWPVPWHDDLSTLGYGSETVNMYFFNTITIPQGVQVELRANIRTHWFFQQWQNSGYGTARREGYWDEQIGVQVDVIE